MGYYQQDGEWIREAEDTLDCLPLCLCCDWREAEEDSDYCLKCQLKIEQDRKETDAAREAELS